MTDLVKDPSGAVTTVAAAAPPVMVTVAAGSVVPLTWMPAWLVRAVTGLTSGSAGGVAVGGEGIERFCGCTCGDRVILLLQRVERCVKGARARTRLGHVYFPGLGMVVGSPPSRVVFAELLM